MSDRTVDVMKKHLLIAEKYIKDIENAKSKQDFMDAMEKCSNEVKNQYTDLEEIEEDYCRRITEGDTELKEISARVGEIFGQKITKHYTKMAPYMADQSFMEAMGNIDIVIGNNPLFGTNEFGADIAVEVSKTIAGSLDGIATKMIADSTDPEEAVLRDLTDILNRFLDLSRRYVAKMTEAGTARKIVTATDSFVDAVKKLVPEMKKHADQIKLILAKKEKPEQIAKLSEELRKVLGTELQQAMKEKQELINDQKVQKSVAKLGSVLSEIPF